jgi:hypothetical protein
MLWLCIFGMLGAVFNPIVVLPLDRSLWIVADWFAFGAMAIAAFAFWKASKT